MRALIRVLGALEAVQALVTSLHPQRRVLLVGAAVDATHSASMIMLAAREPRLAAQRRCRRSPRWSGQAARASSLKTFACAC